MVVEAPTSGVEAWWGEYGAEQWADALVSAMKLGGVDNLFFVSGSELNFYQEAIAKAHAKGRPAPQARHDDARERCAQRRSGKRDGAQPARGDRGARRCRHLALRGGDAHGLARQLSGADDRRHGAARLSRLDARRPRRQHPVDPGAARPGRDRAPVHQDRPPPRAPGQPRPDGQPAAAGRDERATGARSTWRSRRRRRCCRCPAAPAFPPATSLAWLGRPGRIPTTRKTIAAWLVKAENPCIYATKVGHQPEAVAELVRLSELLAIPFMENSNSDRMNFPANSPFYGTGPEAKDADVLLVFEDLVPYIPGRGSPSPDAKIAWVVRRSGAVALQDDRVSRRSVASRELGGGGARGLRCGDGHARPPAT